MSFTPTGEQAVSISIEAEDNASGAFNSAKGSALNMKNAVGAAGTALAGAGVAAFGAAADAAINFEQAMADVEKVTSEAVAQELESDIKDLATEIPLAHEELATLATQAGRMGAESADEIREFTKVAAQMGAATTLSADEAGTALGKMATSLDEPLGNVGELGDAINELSNNFQTTSDEIVDSTQRSGQALSTLGLQSDEILGLSAAFNEVSPSSRQAAQRMQQVAESMMDPDNVEMFANMLGVSAGEFEKMRNEAPQEAMLELMEAVDGNQEAMNTLNNELTTAQARAFRDTADSADTMRDSMEQSGVAMEEGGSLADEVATETDTMAAKMELLRNEIHNIVIDMGNAFLPILIGVVEIISPLISGFASINERLGGLPAVITAATAAIGGLVVAVTTFTGVAAPALLPIVAVLAALAGAAYVLFQAWDNNFGGIQDVVQSVWGTIQSAFGAIYEIAEEVFEQFMIPLVEEVKEVWEEEFEEIMDEVVEIMEIIGEITEEVLEVVGELWDEHGDEIMAVVEVVFGFIQLYIVTTMRAISTAILAFLDIIQGDFSSALGRYEDLWEDTFDDILSFLDMDFAPDVTSLFGDILDTITDVFSDLQSALIGGSRSLVPSTFNDIVDFWNGFVSDVISLFDNFFGDFVDLFSSGLTDSETEVTDFIRDVLRLYVGFWEDVISLFDDRFRMFYQMWRDALSDVFEVLRQTLRNVNSWLRNTAVPLIVTAFETMWDESLDRLIQFLEDLTGNISQTLQNIANWVRSDATSLFRRAFSAVGSAMLSPVQSAVRGIRNAISDLPGYILNTVRRAVSRAIRFFNSNVPDMLRIPEITVGGGNIRVPRTAVSNPFGDDWQIGGEVLDIPSVGVGGQTIDLPQLAEGGVVIDDTLARIGEAGDKEAVVPLHKMAQYLDTAYEVGAETVSTGGSAPTGGSSSALTATLRVEGDDALADLIRENAELVIENHESQKADRIARM